MRALADLPAPRTPAAVQTLLAMRPPLRRLARYGARFGDTFRVEAWVPRGRHDRTRAPLIRATTVVVSAPEDVRAALTASPDVLTAGDAREFVEWWVGEDSILVLDGDEHRRERRAIRPLLAPGRLAGFDRLTRAAAVEALGELPASGRLELGPLIDDLVIRSTLAVLFGATDPELTLAARRMVAASLDAPVWAGAMLLFPALRRDLGHWSPGGRAAAALLAFERLVTTRAERRRGRCDDDGEDDLLGLLLSRESGNCPDEATACRNARLIPMFGQFFTTSAALRWCVLHLVQEPEVWRRAIQEARETDPAPSGAPSYLDAVCSEALRLHPPVPFSLRRARQPTVIAGCRLPAGTYIAPSMFLAHRRPQVFAEPGRFRPGRFLGRSYSPWEFLPFGGGSRGCIGATVARGQMAALLSTLLRQLDLHPTRRFDLTERRRAITLQPRDPLPVEFRRVELTSPPRPRRAHPGQPACMRFGESP